MKKNIDFITIIFWIAIIFYLDPGGFRASAMKLEVDSFKGVLLQSSFVAIAWFCLYLKYRPNENSLINDSTLKIYTIIIIIWSLYYFLWFFGANNIEYINPLKMITRNQRMINQMLIVYPIAYFSSIKLGSFIKILGWSTVIISSMFILSVVFNLDLVEIDLHKRGMGTGASRYLMLGYGIMYFSLPLGLSVLMLKIKNEKIIIIAAILVVIQFFMSIVRRNIIGIIEYTIIIAFLVNYIHKSQVIVFFTRFINFKSISLITFVVVILIIQSPDTIKTYQIIAETTYRTAILGEEKEGGGEDVRMSLTAQYGIVKAIEKNLFLGTGFDPSWNTGLGGTKGYEGSDYIFLAAFGMYGLVGLLIFLPFYIITVKLIIRLLKLHRENLVLIRKHNNIFIYPVVISLATSAEFIKNIIEYPNWFYPIGAINNTPIYFIYFGLLVGSYYQIIKQIHFIKLKHYNE